MHEVPHRLVREVEGFAPLIDRRLGGAFDAEHVPAFLQLKFGVTLDKVGIDREVVRIVHSESGQEGHAALATAVQHDLQRLDAALQ